jgi:hypothetical protein
MFLCLVKKRVTDRFLEQRIDIKFFVKLGKNANGIYAILSEAYEGEPVVMSNVSEKYRRFKVSSDVEITNENNAHHFLRYEGYCSL